MSTYLADTAENLSVEGPSALFAYRRMGPQGGVPLILLNRFRGTIDWWDPEFLDYLGTDHDVILFDNVGIGYSTGEPGDSVEGTRLAAEGPPVSETAAMRQLEAIGKIMAVPPAPSPPPSSTTPTPWPATRRRR